MKEQRFQKIALQIGIIATTIGLLAVATINTVLKDWLVISFGVRALRYLHLVAIGFALAGALIMIVAGSLLVKTQIAKQRERQQQLKDLANYANDSANPEYTRKRFNQLCGEMPKFDYLFTSCLHDMDEMDELQKRQHALLRSNKAEYLDDTVQVLDKVERWICQQFQNMMNLCIVAGAPEHLNMEKVNDISNSVKQKLVGAKALLDVSAEWINQRNEDKNADRSRLEDHIAAITESLKEE